MSSKKKHIELDLTDRQINRLVRLLNFGVSYYDLYFSERDVNENDKLAKMIIKKLL